jgi:Carboxypeptidase regulatory-like domain
MHRLVLLFMILTSAAVAFAQTERANLTGTVTDSTGSVIRDAAVTLQAVATNVNHIARTNSSGVYSFSALPIGEYTLSFTADGFGKEVVNSLTLEVGETRTLNAILRVGAVSTDVQVADQTPDLNLTSPEVSGVIERSQLKDLPVNGRYWASMETLLPGAISSGTGTQDTIRFSGLSQEDNNFRLDGVDATGLNHQFVKTPMRAEFPMESLAELKGSSAAYGADVGSMTGGQISMVTRSGSNVFHGSFYEYLRNSYFDAASWQSNAVAPFKMNQFGASLGGPILRNKMFFFVNYEGVQQAYQSQLQATIPSPSYQSQVLATSPALAFILAAYPQSGGTPTSDPNGYLWKTNTSAPQTENAGLARMDYTLNDKTNITLRFNDDDYLATSSALAEDTVTYTKTPNAMIEVQHTFSSAFLNVAKVAFNRDDYQDVGANTKIQYTVSISGLTSLALGDHSDRVDNSFSFLDNATWYHGRHTVKVGTEIRHMQEHNEHPWLEQSLTYTSEKNFINNALDSYTNQPGQAANLPRKTPVIAYVMDEFKLRPNLTLNAGLQYEFYSSGINKAPGAVVFDPFTCAWQPPTGPYCPAGSPGYNANWLDFMPRIGVMWAPERLHGKTAVRVGFGMYYDDSQPNGGPPGLPTVGKFSLSASNIPNLSYPITPFLGDAAAAAQSYSGRNRNIKDVNVNEWTLSIQQEVARETTLNVTYLGTKGTHLLNGTTLNGIDPATNTRPYASITTSTIGYSNHQGNLTLDALQVGLRRNLSTGLLISANYQWAHEISDGSTGDAENDSYENVLCRQCERGAADFDIRHNFTASTIWDMPVGKGHLLLANATPVVNSLLGGWQMSGIAQARTGFPVNITTSRSSTCNYAKPNGCISPYGINGSLRPDLAPGKTIHDIYTSGTGLNGARLWYDPTALAMPANDTWGNLPRNAVRAPSLWQIDGSMQKRFPLRESMGLSFRADIFNLFNVAHIGSPSASWTAPTGTTFGQITSPFTTTPVGTGTARQMQFSLRFEY